MRDDAVLTLQRVLLAAEGLRAPPAHWMQVLDATLMPMLAELGDRCRRERNDRTAVERTARLALSAVAKTFLQYLGAGAYTRSHFSST